MGPLEIILSSPSLSLGRSARAGWSGLCPLGFWISSRMETPQPQYHIVLIYLHVGNFSLSWVGILCVRSNLCLLPIVLSALLRRVALLSLHPPSTFLQVVIISPTDFFLHTDQTLLPQSLLEHSVLQPCDYLGDFHTGVSPEANIFLVLERAQNWIQNMWSHKSWEDGRVTSLECWLNSSNTGQELIDFLCCMCTLLTHFQLLFHTDTRAFLQSSLNVNQKSTAIMNEEKRRSA